MTGLVWPVQGPITSPFGHRSGVNPLQHNDFHTGIDFGVPVGTPIYATHSGTFRTENNYGGGLMLRVGSSNGWETIYAHTSRAAVGEGTYVKAGTLIGYSGMSGAAVTGPHLHYEVKYQGKHMDPRYAMPVSGPGTAPGAWGVNSFAYDAETAARQQAQQLAQIKRAEAEQRTFEINQARGILGEYAQIARSQRQPNLGIETTRRAPRLRGQGGRRQRFAETVA